MKKLLSFIKEMFNRKDKEEVYIDDIFDPQLKWNRSLTEENSYWADRHEVRILVYRIDQDVIGVSTKVLTMPWSSIFFRSKDREYPKLSGFLKRLELISVEQ